MTTKRPQYQPTGYKGPQGVQKPTTLPPPKKKPSSSQVLFVCKPNGNPPMRAFDHEAERNFYWSFRLLLALAKRCLNEANERRKSPDEWPAGKQWYDLAGSSHAVFLHQAREEAGIPHDEFLKLIAEGVYSVESIYEEVESVGR